MNPRFLTVVSQRLTILTAIAALLIGGPAFVHPARADINDQVAQLDLGKATRADVIRIFGEPQSYASEGRTLTKDNLPSIYIMVYPNDFSVLMNGGRVGELRFGGPAAGYAYRGKLRVGSSLEEALAVLGPPASTVEGGPIGGTDAVLYRDVDGKKGDCYYSRADQHVRLIFQDYKVAGLCVMARQPQGELDAGGKLAKLSAQPAGPVTFPKIDRRPAPYDFCRGALEAAPKYDPKNSDSFQVDLRSYDLSELDLRNSGLALAYANFDDRTVWPVPERLAPGFDRQRVVEIGKNPGLGVRSLHAQGITGRGVGIAIIDNPLLTDHQEYAGRLRLYEEDNVSSEVQAHMHGPAVASLAVGKTVGVAPETDLYYIGRWAMDVEAGKPVVTSKYEAEAIQRILQINEQLPVDRKIRVISISFGWTFGQRGFQEATEAAQKAKAAGLLVISSSVEMTHGFKFHGLGRDLMADPNDFASYRPARWGTEMYANHDRLLVPMDARATASPTGKNEYAFYGEGGWSWAIPYIAGAYALAAQVDPKITPERFWALAMKTGRMVETKDGAKTVSLGPILDPVRLLEAIRRGDLSDKAAVATELAKYAGSAVRDGGDRISEDFAARIARLDFARAGRQEVIEQLGKPASYVLGTEVLDANNLPSQHAMVYPAGVQVVMSADRIARITILAPGYSFRDKIQVGTGQAEVFAVLGPPRTTVENAKRADVSGGLEDGVLYQDFEGVKGSCLYRDRAQGVFLYFEDSRVRQIMLLPKSR